MLYNNIILMGRRRRYRPVVLPKTDDELKIDLMQ